MDGSTQIQIVTIICSTFLAAMTLWLRRDVRGMLPEIQDVRKQLIEANRVIIAQGVEVAALRDELVMRKPTVTKKQFDEDYSASPPYRKPDK